MKPPFLKTLCQSLTLLVLLANVSTLLAAANTWRYQQDTDRLNNQNFSLAVSPLPRRDLYDDIRLEVVCKNKALQVTVTTESLIASQGSKFDLSYQIDQHPPVALQMTTSLDSKRSGYVDEQAQSMIKDILAGKEVIFLKITTMTRKELAGAISLDGAVQNITKVSTDCAMGGDKNSANPDSSKKDVSADYDFVSFQKDFNKLPAERQKQLLNQIRALITETN
jgi:hypothetical protein